MHDKFKNYNSRETAKNYRVNEKGIQVKKEEI